jgi:hypothetical protein
MHHKRVKLMAVILFGIGIVALQAQETFLTFGGNATGSGGETSYSAGQVVYTTNTGSDGSVAQGVQQPFEISSIVEIEEAKSINLIYMVYPNPSTTYLTLRIEKYDKEKLSYQLYDLNGKLLESNTTEDNETKIKMSDLTPDTYFLKVIRNSKEIKTFKIVKTQ